MAAPRIKDRKELTEEWIRRFITYTDRVTWFGSNSVARAWAIATAGLVENSYQLYVAILRRFTLFASRDEDLAIVAAERGADRLTATRARLLVIIRPFSADVTAVTLGATDLIEVDDSSGFLAGDSIRIRNGDGTVSDVRTIIAITIGTGPNLGDELEVAVLTGAYTPLTDDVDVLIRVLVPEGTLVTADSVQFATLENVTTGDANPILDGEGTFVGLADKVWTEATVRGASGNIEPRTITALVTPIAGVVDVFNPERGLGGADNETDFELKRRAIEGPSVQAQETAAWFEALAKQGNSDLIRVVRPEGEVALGTLIMRVLNRNGGNFSATEIADMETFVEQRVRSYMEVSIENITLTSVEIEAQITIESDGVLEDIWREYSQRVAAYLDFRKWAFGTDVDSIAIRKILEDVPGVAAVDQATFSPSVDIVVTDISLPTLTRISLIDLDTADTVNADLAVSF
jgi:uncharacterized phage protein gp47/JayE